MIQFLMNYSYYFYSLSLQGTRVSSLLLWPYARAAEMGQGFSISSFYLLVCLIR